MCDKYFDDITKTRIKDNFSKDNILSFLKIIFKIILVFGLLFVIIWFIIPKSAIIGIGTIFVGIEIMCLYNIDKKDYEKDY